MEQPRKKGHESGERQQKNTHVLIVYAHQEPKSFNRALKDVAVDVFRELGHTVEVSDLYAQNFNPVCTRDDFKGELLNPNHFKYDEEAQNAYQNGSLPGDIVAEQEKVNRADLIIFQFPLYWCSFPAIMKGWFDRVFGLGYAFTHEKLCDEGCLQGKRAILSFTTGSPGSAFTERGLCGDLKVFLWPIHHGILYFCGFEVLSPHVVYSPDYMTQSQREAALAEWATRLRHLHQEKPLEFIPNSCMDMKEHQLSDEFLQSQRAKGDMAPTVGQHLGKKLPVGDVVSQG